MPILTEAAPPRKRRAPVWLLILAVVVLPPVGLFGWSCYRTVHLKHAHRWIAFGRTKKGPANRNSGPGWTTVNLKLPGGRFTGWYGWFVYWGD
jgi:hypothetical protein